MSSEPDPPPAAAPSAPPATNTRAAADPTVGAPRVEGEARTVLLPTPVAGEAPVESSPAVPALDAERLAPAAPGGLWWPFGSLWSVPAPRPEASASESSPDLRASPSETQSVTRSDGCSATSTDEFQAPAEDSLGPPAGLAVFESLDSPQAGAIGSEAALVAVEPAAPAEASYYDWLAGWFGSAVAGTAHEGSPNVGSLPVFVAEIAPREDGAQETPLADAGNAAAQKLEGSVAAAAADDSLRAERAAPRLGAALNGDASSTAQVESVVALPAAEGALVAAPPSSTGMLQAGVAQVGNLGAAAVDGVRASVVAALVAGIRMVSAERDRDEILRWFVGARQILAEGGTTAKTASDLYQSVRIGRFVQLLGSTLATSVSNYHGANLPLSLKIAMPAAMLGMAFFGMQGAGVVALGGGVGLPVVLLIFLGTAGATAVLEAFVKDRSIRDPLTKLLLTFAAYESARRAKKELLDALRADAMVPERAEAPDDAAELLDFLLAMDPTAFERHVMSFFAQEGHPTGLTARSNDFGVDGYVFHPDGLVVVQCKRYALDNPVGRPEVQQFKGVLEEQRAYRGYFVTTCRFTAGASESAGKNDRLRLVDGETLLRWHREGWKPG